MASNRGLKPYGSSGPSQHVHERIDRKPIDVSAHQIRNARLAHTKQLGGLLLIRTGMNPRATMCPARCLRGVAE